jgi:hypothetical protein
MHATFLTTAMVSLLSALTATALPTTEEAPVNKRASPGLYLCENARFQGYCYHYTTPWGVCSTFLCSYHSIPGTPTYLRIYNNQKK